MDNTVFTGEFGRMLEIIVLGSTYPNAECISDRNWLTVEISITSGPFSGKTNANICTYEFETMYNGINALLKSTEGEFVFEAIEKWISLSVCGDGCGHYKNKGFVADDFDESKNKKLVFTIDSDYSSMTNTLRDLKYIIEKYPVEK